MTRQRFLAQAFLRRFLCSLYKILVKVCRTYLQHKALAEVSNLGHLQERTTCWPSMMAKRSDDRPKSDWNLSNKMGGHASLKTHICEASSKTSGADISCRASQKTSKLRQDPTRSRYPTSVIHEEDFYSGSLQDTSVQGHCTRPLFVQKILCKTHGRDSQKRIRKIKISAQDPARDLNTKSLRKSLERTPCIRSLQANP